MKRILFWPSSTILLLGILVLPACGQQDTAEAVTADCSGHIPHEKVETCLERARVIDETNPSANLQALEQQLQRRALHREEAQGAPPPGSDPNRPPPGYTPDQGPPPSYASDQGPPPGANQPPPQNYDPNREPPQGFDNSPPPPPPASDEMPPPEGPSGDIAPPVDRTGPGDLTPPDEGPEGPPPDDTPPPDDSETQGPGQ